jgi:hypothetical protein
MNAGSARLSVVPGWRNSGGCRAVPTPDGVPVKIRSPGSMGHTAEIWATS